MATLPVWAGNRQPGADRQKKRPLAVCKIYGRPERRPSKNRGNPGMKIFSSSYEFIDGPAGRFVEAHRTRDESRAQGGTHDRETARAYRQPPRIVPDGV